MDGDQSADNDLVRDTLAFAAGRMMEMEASDRGGERAAAIYTLLQTAKLNNVDPQAWLADTPTLRLADLLPWKSKRDQKPNAT